MIEPISKTMIAIGIGSVAGGVIKAIAAKVRDNKIHWGYIALEGVSFTFTGAISGSIIISFLGDANVLLSFGISGLFAWAGANGLTLLFEAVRTALKANLDITTSAVKSTETHTTEVKTTEVNQ